MELYFSTRQMPAALFSALDILHIPYLTHSIEEDPSAQKLLLELSGTLTVPTLVFDDGSYLVEPTPAQFAEKMLSLQPAQPEAVTASPLFLLSVWTRICAVISLGLGAFGAGFGLGNVYSVPGVAILVVAIAVLFIGTVVLSLVIPPIKRWMATLGKHVVWKSAKWLFVPLYAGLMGLSLGSQHKLFDVWLWIGFIAFAIILTVITTVLTRDLWAGWAERIQKAQGWIGIVALVSFVGVLVVSTLLNQTGLLHSLMLPQFLLLSLMFGFGGFQLIAARQQASPINRAMGVLFPAIGLLVIVGLL